MESPEVWFEDFGSAKLARGRALVKLDSNFAKVIKRGDYRVFVTPEGNCHGLYVRHKSANKFEVREVMGGKSSIRFPTASSAVARISSNSGASPKSTWACLCQQGHHAHRVSQCRRRRICAARIEKEGRERLPKRPEKVRPQYKASKA